MRTETVRDRLAARPYLLRCTKCVIAQPLIQRDPVLGAIEDECVRLARADWTGPWPAQEPVLAVREHAHAHAVASLLRGLQVAINLLDPLRFGLGVPGPDLELHVGVERRQVHGLSGLVPRMDLLDNLISGRELCRDQEITHRARDVRLSLAEFVSPQDGPGQFGVLRIVVVNRCGHRIHGRRSGGGAHGPAPHAACAIMARRAERRTTPV